MSRQKRDLSLSSLLLIIPWSAFSAWILNACVYISQHDAGTYKGQALTAIADKAYKALSTEYLICLVAAGVLIAALLYCAVRVTRLHNMRFSILSALLALFFTFNSVIMLSPDVTLDSLVFLPNLSSHMDSIILWAAIAINYYMVIMLITGLLRHPLDARLDVEDRGRHDVWFYILMLLIGWISIYVRAFPGSICFDSTEHIAMYNGNVTMDASNPVLVIYIYGFLFNLGEKVQQWLSLGVNAAACGLCACVMFQILLWVVSISKLCNEVRKVTGNRILAFALCAFFAFFLIWGAFLQDVLKDSVYTGFFCLFLLYYWRVLRGSNKDIFWMVITALLAMFSRKSGMLLIAPPIFFLIIHRKGAIKLLIAFAMIFVIACDYGATNYLYPALNIQPEEEKQNYSFFYWQTAYYVSQHGNEITDEEKAIINDVLNYDELVNNFNRTSVDKLKGTYHAENDEQIKAFVKLNLQFMLRHPLTCLEACVYTKYKYYVPFTEVYAPVRTSIVDIGRFKGVEAWNITRTAEQQASLDQLNADVKTMYANPIGRVLATPGLYCWICLLLLVASIKNHDGYRFCMTVPICILVFGLVLTHVNGEFRYSVPVMASVPFLAALQAYAPVPKPKKSKKDKSSEPAQPETIPAPQAEAAAPAQVAQAESASEPHGETASAPEQASQTEAFTPAPQAETRLPATEQQA